MPLHTGSTGASAQVVTGWTVAAWASNANARHAASGHKRRPRIFGTRNEVNIVSALENCRPRVERRLSGTLYASNMTKVSGHTCEHRATIACPDLSLTADKGSASISGVVVSK
jgi:hypothetical protein